jgi:ferredoxin-NADP reductase/bacterioferritin-associated ferredoxin
MTLTTDSQLRASESFVCGCLALSAADIRRCVARGFGDAERVAAECGAATHCGACAQAVTRLVGHPGGTQVRVASLERLGVDSLRLSLRPAGDGGFAVAARPGQHAVLAIQGPLGWVARPYTITSCFGDSMQREFVVRCLPEGRMGAVLEQLALEPDGFELRLGSPRGSAFARLDGARPVAFLCGGVGLTPAVAALRAGAALRPVLVHASFRTEEPGLESLLQAACDDRSVPLVVRRADRDGLPTAADLRAVLAAHPGVDWFVCGPDGYREMVFAAMREEGVPAGRIHEERFVPALDASSSAPARARTRAESLWARVAIGLSAVWCLAMLLPRPEAMSALWSEDAWRWTTGGMLSVVLAGQWVFPFVRGKGQYDRAMRLELAHRALGAIAPLFLVLHQRSFGHGLLMALGGLFVANTILGAFDKTAVRDPLRRERWLRFWLPAHVVLSFALTGLALWHLWMVVRFQGALS